MLFVIVMFDTIVHSLVKLQIIKNARYLYQNKKSSPYTRLGGRKCAVTSDRTPILARLLSQNIVIICGNNRLVSAIFQPSVAISSVLSVSQEYFLILNYASLSCNCFCN